MEERAKPGIDILRGVLRHAKRYAHRERRGESSCGWAAMIHIAICESFGTVSVLHAAPVVIPGLERELRDPQYPIVNFRHGQREIQT